MKTRFFAAFVAMLVCLSPLHAEPAAPLADDPPPADEYVIRLELRQGDPRGSVEDKSIRVLATSSIATVADRPAELKVGGEVAAADELVPFGTVIRICASQLDDGRVRIRGSLETSSVHKSSDEVVLRESLCVHFAKPVVLNEKVTVPLQQAGVQHRWCEILVEPRP